MNVPAASKANDRLNRWCIGGARSLNQYTTDSAYHLPYSLWARSLHQYTNNSTYHFLYLLWARSLNQYTTDSTYHFPNERANSE
jgi:hypothetical protein